MKVNICAWVGQSLPSGWEKGERDVTPEEILKLFEQGYDVALMHSSPERQTKKAMRRDGANPDLTPILAIDEKYRHFHQR